MRIFDDGSRQIYTTANRGGNLKFIEGGALQPPTARSIVASVEAIYKDTERKNIIKNLRTLERLLPTLHVGSGKNGGFASLGTSK
jgi:hypothetical protein